MDDTLELAISVLLIVVIIALLLDLDYYFMSKLFFSNLTRVLTWVRP